MAEAAKLVMEAEVIPPGRAQRAAAYLGANLLFRLVLFLLVLVVLSAILLNGILAWSIGLVYIAYDSWLLWYMVRSSRRSVRNLKSAVAAETLPAAPVKITVLVSAYNELLVLPECIRALRQQTDKADEIIIVDDGSTDDSIAYLKQEFDLQFEGAKGKSNSDPRYKVLRKDHSGKASSLNEAWPQTENEIVLTLDADTILDEHALGEVRRAFAANPFLSAACGVLTPKCRGNFEGRWFEFYQSFEYYRAFLWRLAWTSSESLLLVSGAFSAYRKDLLIKVGGFDSQSLVEDYDLIYRLHRYAGDHNEKMQVQVISSARATTDAPAGIRTFLHQRSRWFCGFLQTLSRNADMIGSSRFGRVGQFMLPVKTVDTLLPVYALMAAAVLILLLVAGGRIDPRIIMVLVAKAIFDLIYHYRAIYTYKQWQGVPFGQKPWVLTFGATLLATATEPFAFQLLRHTGALMGWIAFLRGRTKWVPQRS